MPALRRGCWGEMCYGNRSSNCYRETPAGRRCPSRWHGDSRPQMSYRRSMSTSRIGWSCRSAWYPVQWPVCPTPVRLCNWEEFLQSHPDQGFASYIRTGLSAGFRIGFNRGGPGWLPSANNHPSARANAQVIREYIAEVRLGRLVGPLKKVILPWVQTSQIGLVSKAHQVDKWRMIVPPGPQCELRNFLEAFFHSLRQVG